MRLYMTLVLCFLVALSLAGCRSSTTSEEEPGAPAVNSSGPAADEAPAVETTETAAEIPPCDPADFCPPGMKVMVHQMADLDYNHTQESCVVGCQAIMNDELGDPLSIAEFKIASWDGSQWKEWPEIQAEHGEKFVDENSIVSTDDINEDGTVELALMFYGSGVSSRPVNLYVWQVMGETLAVAIENGYVQMSSDDGSEFADVTEDTPGLELVVARAKMGSEAHAAPHKYDIIVYGWNGYLYTKDRVVRGKSFYDSPDAALAAFKQGTFR